MPMSSFSTKKARHVKANKVVQAHKSQVPSSGEQPRPHHVAALRATVAARHTADATSSAPASVRKRHQAYTKKQEGMLLEAQYAPPTRPSPASQKPKPVAQKVPDLSSKIDFPPLGEG